MGEPPAGPSLAKSPLDFPGNPALELAAEFAHSYRMNRRPLPAILALAALVAFCSVTRASEPLRRIASRITHDIGAKHPRVALLSFAYDDDRKSQGSTIVAERLTTLLVSQRKLHVIERHLLTKLLEEQHLSETGVIDPKAAQQIGQVLDVDILVTGTLQDLPDRRTQVNARAIDARSGEVVSAASATIDKTWFDRPPEHAAVEAAQPDEGPSPVDDKIEVGYAAGGPAGRGGGRPAFRPLGRFRR